jgi:release factor glutamine methyltransferase
MQPDAESGRDTAPAHVGGLLRACSLAAPEARALLAHAMGVAREHLVTHAESAVDATVQARFADLVRHRSQGTPMAYLLGFQEFYGHRLRVTPAVLIPRPDTELLVETALQVLAHLSGARVLELGTGSGCIAIALALARPDLVIVATDVSVAALEIARGNARRLGARLHLVGADWFAPLRGTFDLLISNPPYIAPQDRHLTALTFEPRGALTDGCDGLAALRIVIAGAPALLADGGTLLLEHGYDQGIAVRALAAAGGFDAAKTLVDLGGRDRACLARITRAA